MKYLILSFLCIFGLPFRSLSQPYVINTDTIKLHHTNFKNPKQLKDFIDYTFEHFQGNPNNGLKLIEFAINRCKANKNNELLAKAINVKGVILESQSQFTAALKAFLESIIVFEKTNNYYSIAILNNNIGKLFLGLQKNNEAEIYFKRAETICLQHKLNNVLTLVYSNLASIYIGNGKLDEGLRLALLSEKLNKNEENARVQNVNANNIGALYFFKNDFDNALKYYEKAQKLSEISGDWTTYYRAEWNIGETYETTKKRDPLQYYQNALNHFTKIKDLEASGGICTYISNYYEAKGDHKQALAFYKKAILNTQQNSSIQSKKQIAQLQTEYETVKKELTIKLLNKSDSLKNLTITQNLLKINKQQLKLADDRLRIKLDSLHILNQKQAIYLGEMNAKKRQEHIEKLKKEATIKQLELDKKNSYIFIVSIFACLLIISGYAIYRRRILEHQNQVLAEQAKQREILTKAIIEAEENERTRIGHDLHDGVGQLFAAVKMNLSGLFDRIEFTQPNQQFLAEKTLALVDESCKEVRILSHKMMPNMANKSGLANDIKAIVEKLDEGNLKVHFSESGFSDQLEHNEEVILFKVIQELIANTIKHAKASEIWINIQKNKETIEANVSDNGIGFTYSEEHQFGGIGLKNIQTRVKYLKGEIDFKTAILKGTQVSIKIPIA